MTQQVDYRALTAAGVPIATFADRDLAMKWVKANRREYPGCSIERVVRSELRETIYRSRIRPVLRVVSRAA